MKRPDGTARAWRFWPRSWAASVALTLALLACGGSKAPSPGSLSAGTQEVLAGWMGQYSRRDEGLRVLLSSQEGWNKLRDMALFDAAALFSGGAEETDRIGAARAYLALAETFAALDELYLAVEHGYLEGLGARANEGERERREWVRRRRKAAASVGTEGTVELVSRVHGLAGRGVGRGAHARAAEALAAGDFGAARSLLESLDGSRPDRAVASDLFVYVLSRRAYAGLGLRALGELRTSEASFYSGLAREHLGDDRGALAQFSAVAEGNGPGLSAAWLFSSCLGAGEAARLAAVHRASILQRQGRRAEALAQWEAVLAGTPGPLVLATLAAEQQRTGAARPLADPLAAATGAIAEASALSAQLPSAGPDDLLHSLYPVRVAAVSRVAAAVLSRAGQGGRALDALERAHRKTRGFRPDFVNDPPFLLDLCRAYVDAGDYAPAVAVLFELNREVPSARLAYEGLKRLYAARSGGETQPRY